MKKKPVKPASKGGLRIVALFEALKGVLVLLVGCGLLTFIHKDLHDAAMHLVRVLHLNPAKHYPSIFIDAANKVTDLQLWMIALSALLYATVRLVEAYGLWRQMQWAEWFGLLSGAMYIPLEIFEASREFTWPRVTVLVVNLAVVGYLGDALLRSRKSPTFLK
ncbi:membrane protein [Geomonas limicola]|uniref:Membrane protein n=1 Tax=Geomonas limicola TaxID=2740186 RepID=A0A6V8N4G6_9BACT|nr:DUF2127 domain-containing protein [Geomonas limicola]GFO67260.1 membrane protein [Geomonas limicola]